MGGHPRRASRYAGSARARVTPQDMPSGSVSATVRCGWATTPISSAYHDAEWGVPVHDDGVLFEFLILEGAQAGLSWETILKKRQAYRQAFVGLRSRARGQVYAGRYRAAAGGTRASSATV